MGQAVFVGAVVVITDDGVEVEVNVKVEVERLR
jgi:hypothetical protein